MYFYIHNRIVSYVVLLIHLVITSLYRHDVSHNYYAYAGPYHDLKYHANFALFNHHLIAYHTCARPIRAKLAAISALPVASFMDAMMDCICANVD